MSKLLLSLLISTSMLTAALGNTNENVNEPSTSYEIDETPLDDDYPITTIDVVEGCAFIGKIAFTYSFDQLITGDMKQSVANIEKSGFSDAPYLAETIYDDVKDGLKGEISKLKQLKNLSKTDLMSAAIEKSLDNSMNVTVNCTAHYLED